MTGANAMSIAPLVASKAKMLLRAIGVAGSSAVATLVNRPPATTLLPTTTMASTLPSSTCGVQLAGSAGTTAACGMLTAWLRHEADQDHGRHERRKQDSATHETTNPPSAGGEWVRGRTLPPVWYHPPDQAEIVQRAYWRSRK
jgi:hypothetical protein